MGEQETVNVTVGTEEELYPVLSIRKALDEYDLGRSFAIPAALLDALQHAQEMVEAAQVAIMEHIRREYPEAGDIADWLDGRAEDAALEAARAAWAAEHPEGPDWQLIPVRERQRLIDAQMDR